MTIVGPTDLGIGKLFERVTDAVVVADPEIGSIALWNLAATQLFGYAANEVVGCPVEILIPPRLRAAHQAGFAHFRTTGHGRHVDSCVPMELPALTKAGDEIWIEMTLSPIERLDGRPYLLAVIREVTERKRAEEAIRALNADLDRRLAEQAARLEAAAAELRASEERYRRLYGAEQEARAEAEEALALRDEFLAIAAHELKTPTTSLLLNAQHLLRTLHRNGELTSGQLEVRLRRIETQAQKQAHLVQHLLDVSYIQQGQLRLDTEDADLTTLVDDVVKRFQEAQPETPIVYCAPRSVVVRVDPLRLEQVVKNLLDNALAYGRSTAGITVKVSQSTPTQVTIGVRDHGPGIAPEDREHLFERFFRGPGHKYTAGLGLGLYVSKQIVEAHGGTITAEFPESGGSLFTVLLPVS